MDEKYNVLGPKSTIKELVILAAKELTTGRNAFDFDIHGTAPDGSPIVLHFEATMQAAGSA